jgi:hypothetical protein
MQITEQIKAYIKSQPEPKRTDMETLHQRILKISPSCQLWFLDGKDEQGKTVSNPNIGYGLQTMKYAGGKTRDFYQIGMSANTTGISIYIMGVADKNYLAQTYGNQIGKASITGYCIKFKNLQQIQLDVLESAICFGLGIEK